MRYMIVILLSTGAALAADDSTRLARWAFMAAATADFVSTERVLDAGHTELNPALPDYPTDSRLATQSLVWSGLVLYSTNRLNERHPRAAKAILWSLAAIHVAAAYHNERLP